MPGKSSIDMSSETAKTVCVGVWVGVLDVSGAAIDISRDYQTGVVWLA